MLVLIPTNRSFASVTSIQTILGKNKKLDHFEPARLDHHHPVEEVVQSLKQLVDEGLFSYIGLSEVNASTLRRAVKVSCSPNLSGRSDLLSFRTQHESLNIGCPDCFS